MLDRIDKILQHECQIRQNNILVVGVSGGPDSICLLHILNQLDYSVIAVHVNHRLRLESDDESKEVKRIVANLGVDIISVRVDVMKSVWEESVSVEEAARNLRYRELFEQAHLRKAAAVVVGHNADDQVETILMHLLRGSGLKGLRGMEYRSVPNPWSEEIPLIRPLLSTWRMEIQSYIDAHQLSTIFDRSNLDTSFFRNRVRHELIPTLQSYNPGVGDALLRMGQVIKDDYSVFEGLTEQAWDACLIEQDPGFLSFRYEPFQKLPVSIQRYLLRKAIDYFLPGSLDVGFDCVERGLGLLDSEVQKTQMDLIGGVRLIKAGEIFTLATWQADLTQGNFPAILANAKLEIVIPSSLKLLNGWQLDVEQIEKPDLEGLRYESKMDPVQAWLDVPDERAPLFLRVRKPADTIQPLGLNGHTIKITDLMINLKLPKQSRNTWPLVCSGEQILWVPGYRINECARLKDGTTRVIHLRLHRL